MYLISAACDVECSVLWAWVFDPSWCAVTVSYRPMHVVLHCVQMVIIFSSWQLFFVCFVCSARGTCCVVHVCMSSLIIGLLFFSRWLLLANKAMVSWLLCMTSVWYNVLKDNYWARECCFAEQFTTINHNSIVTFITVSIIVIHVYRLWSGSCCISS